jgi:hypothetical protein
VLRGCSGVPFPKVTETDVVFKPANRARGQGVRCAHRVRGPALSSGAALRRRRERRLGRTVGSVPFPSPRGLGGNRRLTSDG